MKRKLKRTYPTGCWNCAYFDNDPQSIERTFKGFTILCSAYAAVRGDSGICYFDEIFRMPREACDHYEPALEGGEVWD